MIAAEVQHHLSRARDFVEGMNRLLNEEVFILRDDFVRFKYSPALLGIHGAISYCDALRIGMGSEKLSSDDHRNATRELKSLLAERKFQGSAGADRLDKLLGKKSRIAYAREASDETEIKQITLHAERFAKWAEAAGRTLKIGG
ncbi:MAG TPA: hypothetical protein VG225_09070 [Terracidiphilus sp.]|jgi:hypothetical protein|nr:hypothetical protein [Terracidiphilus sp.]